MRNTFADTMLEVGRIDPKLVVLVGDISHFALQPFAEDCPGRFYNIGICEPTIVSMAAGLSHTGYHPVVHTIAPFLIERSFEQIKLDFCYQEKGGNLISVGSAFDYSGLGVSHFCYNDIALIKSLPRTQIIYPAMPNEFKILFNQTYANKYLTYFRLPAHKHGFEIPNEKIKFGKAVITKEGSDVTIVAVGPQLATTMESIPVLEKMEINAEVIYLPTIKPFDDATVKQSINKTGKYLVIEEHSQFGGVGDEVMRATKDLTNIKSRFLNLPDNFSHGYGSYSEHCSTVGLTSNSLIDCIQTLVS
jgi:transketolase